MTFLRLALAVCAAFGLSLFGASDAGAVAVTKHPETLRAFVQRLLVVAPSNFAGVRGALTKSEVYNTRYAILPKFGACGGCKLNDEFAWTAHTENWYVENEWNAAKTWSHAQLLSFVSAQLSTPLAAYSLKKTGTKDYPTFMWIGKKGTWVYVHVFNGGFTLRVGHDLAKPVHVLLPPTASQMAALQAGATSFVNSGVPAAPTNFASLRAGGKKDALDDTEYDLYVPFGAMFPKCHVYDASVNTLGLDDYSPKWTMTCESVPMVGSKATLEPQILSAVQAALPAGFNPTTGKLLFVDDYRWDDTSTQVSVDIDSFSSYSLPDGLVEFGISIIHFIPSQK